ncbi:MAG: hypothetical protein NUV91_04600, partial [Candidatus Omnitrophica bacterium]|nr:hypothetical protein [Candidatus Omnitrophota bacterium]
MLGIRAILFSFVLVLGLSSMTFAEWVTCGDRQVEIKRTTFRGHGVEIYEMSGGGIYVKEEKSSRIRFCYPLPVDWAFVGFKTFPTKDNAQQVVVFEVRNQGVPRYFNIEDGKEVMVASSDTP